PLLLVRLSIFLFLLALSTARPPSPPLFPYTTLFRSGQSALDRLPVGVLHLGDVGVGVRGQDRVQGALDRVGEELRECAGQRGGVDRKSTRLNSSHVSISYAVFCLKKKKKIKRQAMRR